MKLYNTFSRKIEEIKPINKNKIGLYACGPTVYDYAHIGHLRKYTMDDILIRVLKHNGYLVNFVQNITDVGHLTSDEDTGEDKLEKGAKKYGESVWEIAKKFEDYFFKSMKLMGNLPPSTSAKATDHIKEQLNMVIDLEKKGFAYVIKNDGVYFDTSKFSDYGKIAKLDLRHQREGERVAKVEGKRNPADFALWKFEREGENRAMVWESPWVKRSFPGWHIECSAMSMKYLGDQFDIHTGGIDHIPVHHTNEIAQSEAFSGKSPFVRYWVHHNFLKVEGTKMSKSLGNFYTIDDVLERGFIPQALRLLFLTAHYQSELNFTWENLAGIQKSYFKLLKLVSELKKDIDNNFDDRGDGVGVDATENYNNTISINANDVIDNISDDKNQIEYGEKTKLKNEEMKFKSNFFNSLNNNLDTPGAVAILWETAKSNLSSDKKLKLLLEFDQILNLGFKNAKNILDKEHERQNNPSNQQKQFSTEIQTIIDQRATARSSNDWQKSDELRDLLLEKGYKVVDLSSGQSLEEL